MASTANRAGSFPAAAKADFVRKLNSEIPNQLAIPWSVVSFARYERSPCFTRYCAKLNRNCADDALNQASSAGQPPTFGGLNGSCPIFVKVLIA